MQAGALAGKPSRTADSGGLALVTEAQAGRFRDVLLAAGYLPASPETSSQILELRARGGRNLPRLLRSTRSGRPLHTLARLFLLNVAVPEAEAREAFRPAPLEEWIESRIVTTDGDAVSARVAIQPYEGLLLAFDKPELLDHGTGADYVGGVTNSTASLVAFMVRRQCPSVLDIGTGCGVLAFLAARHSGSVLATDINPRAIDFARFNARLNGIRNVEFAVGASFEPVRGRKFDLILANPPCVLGPAVRYTFRDSGPELDTLGRQLVTEAPAYLAPGGLFQCTAEWPNFGEDWKDRVTGWLPTGSADALVLHVRQKDSLLHAEETVAETDVLDAGEQSRLFHACAEYFQSRGVRSVSEGLIALRRRVEPGPPWVRFEDLPAHGLAPFGDAVWRCFEAGDTLQRLGECLLDQKLRLSPGVSVTTSRTWNGAAWNDGCYSIRQEGEFELQASLDVRIANLIRQCEGGRTLRELAADLATGAGVSVDAVTPGCLAVMRRLIERGFIRLPE